MAAPQERVSAFALENNFSTRSLRLEFSDFFFFLIRKINLLSLKLISRSEAARPTRTVKAFCFFLSSLSSLHDISRHLKRKLDS